jgi:transposase
MKAKERAEARSWRQQGRSIKEIAKRLLVSKGSVSAWVSDIELTEEPIRLLEERQQKGREYLLGRGQRLKAAAASRA